MPISTALLLACLTALRFLCFALTVLFGLLALRAQFDPDVLMPWSRALIGGGVFLMTGIVIGIFRKAIARRARFPERD